MSKKVAIITRTKNRPLLLERCLLSVLNQTFEDWQHVIVNDGGDAAVVEEITGRLADRYDGRLKIIHNPASVGMQNASNVALRASESEFVTIHDDDDSWQPTFLEECVRYLNDAGLDSIEQGVVTQTICVMEEIDSHGNIFEHSRSDFMPVESVSLFQMAKRNFFPPIAFLYRRSVHQTIGYFEQDVDVLGDYDFNLRFLSRYDIGTIHRHLANYHLRQKASGGSYGNTVIDGVADHRRMLVRLQNRYLRQDLAEQKLGLGFLVNLAPQISEQVDRLNEIKASSGKVKSVLLRTTERLLVYDNMVSRLLMPVKVSGRFLGHAAEWFRAKPTGNSHPATNGHSSKASLQASLNRAKILSLDVFDTAIMRLVRHPTDVFLYIEPEVRRLLNRPNLAFVAMRIAAEQESREEMLRSAQSSETTLAKIYEVLQRRLGCDSPTAKKIEIMELEAERRLCFANPEIAGLTEWASKNARKVVFASDMYLPAQEMTVLLEKNGFKNEGLFVSAELRVSKHDGRLFDHVVEHLKCRPGELLHVGDNGHSDVDRARARGIEAHHWRRTFAQLPLVEQYPSTRGSWNGDLASSLYTGLVSRRRLSHPLERATGKPFWTMIGYEVVGPLFHSFTSWVMSRAEKQGLAKLFFLARDGYQLARTFELLRQHSGVKLEASYLFASRRLFAVARIRRLNEEALELLVKAHPHMCVADFIARIGLDPAPHESLARQCGFAGLHEQVTTKDIGVFKTPAQLQGMRRLMQSLDKEILELAQREREQLSAYFQDAGLLKDGTAIVDIGWSASASRSVPLLLEHAGTPKKIPGFYFGTWNTAQSVLLSGSPFESFFMHLNLPQYRAQLLLESVSLLETFFYAPHPTITGVEKKNGDWQALYGEPDLDTRTAADLELVMEGAFEFIRDAVSLFPKSTEIAPAFAYLETVLERLLRHPRKDEAAALGNFAWRESFSGSVSMIRLASLPSAWRRITSEGAIQKAYDFCYWKRGFLAQLSERERTHVKL